MSRNLSTRRPHSVFPWFRHDPMFGLRDEMGDLFGRFLGDWGDDWLARGIAPPADLSETDSAVEVRIDLPGIKPEEIDIQLNGSVVTVSGERKEEQEDKGKRHHRVERRAGSFSRSITLPCGVQEQEVEAQYRDGVLTITLPKTEQAKTRKIEVKS